MRNISTKIIVWMLLWLYSFLSNWFIVKADDSSLDFYKVPLSVNINLRVLDEAKRVVKWLDISMSSSSNCQLNFTASQPDDNWNITLSTNASLDQLNYDCLFPTKLKIIDHNDNSFPSWIVTLPLPDENIYWNIIKQGRTSIQSEYQKWSSDTIQKQKFPTWYSVFKIWMDVSIDIRADYQQHTLTAYSDTPVMNIWSYFQNTLVWYEMNDSYNEIGINFSWRWTNEKITDIRPKDIGTSSWGVTNMQNGWVNVNTFNNNTGTWKEDVFAQQFWQTALQKYANTSTSFNPYANLDKISFYGKVVSMVQKKMLGNFVVYLTDMQWKMIQKTISLDNWTYFFFPDWLTNGAKYNIVVPNTGYNNQFSVPYDGKMYPLFQQYWQSIVYEGDGKEIDLFLSPNIIKETSPTIIQQSWMSAWAKAVIIVFIIMILLVWYSLVRIHQKEKSSWQSEL